MSVSVKHLTDQQLRAALTQARRVQGVSQTAVAVQMGVKQPTLASLENKENANPTVGTLQRYASALGLEVRHELIDRAVARFMHPPEGVTFYASWGDFVAEDSCRKNRGNTCDWYTGGFTLTDTFWGPEDESEWSINVNRREVYAAITRGPGLAFEDGLSSVPGALWLIDTIPETMDPGFSGTGIRPIMDHVDGFKGNKDSLLDAVDWIRASLKIIRAWDPDEMNH